MSANAAAEVAARLRAVAVLAESAAPRAAVQALGRTGEVMAKLTLSFNAHSLGTPTTAPAGGPPGLISGALRRSVARTPAVPTGPATWSQALGSVIHYAAVHEFGPVTITAKNFPVLGNPTVGFFGKSVTIPARPWMKPTVEKLISSELGAKAAIAAFEAAIDA